MEIVLWVSFRLQSVGLKIDGKMRIVNSRRGKKKFMKESDSFEVPKTFRK